MNAWRNLPRRDRLFGNLRGERHPVKNSRLIDQCPNPAFFIGTTLSQPKHAAYGGMPVDAIPEFAEFTNPGMGNVLKALVGVAKKHTSPI
jgi:hypothetical protein